MRLLYICSFLSVLFFASFFFFCLSLFLHPKKTILLKALVYYCFLVFRCIGEYISLNLFYFVNLTSSSLILQWQCGEVVKDTDWTQNQEVVEVVVLFFKSWH